MTTSLHFDHAKLRGRALVLGLAVVSLHAQKPAADPAAAHFIGHALYLREAWAEDKLTFDAAGHPTTPAHHGPLTLAGFEVTAVRLNGDLLVLSGRRVALVASEAGQPLHRVPTISSTTEMLFTLRRTPYRADEPVEYRLTPDAHGSYFPALHAAFADGLADLAPSVPAWWRCYAAAWFAPATPASDADSQVMLCATRAAHLPPEQPGLSPVEVVSSVAPRPSPAAAQLGLTGEVTVFASVDEHGQPADFQVLTPLGAGVDEEVLQAVSRFGFRPATRDDQNVRAAFQFTIRYSKTTPDRQIR